MTKTITTHHDINQGLNKDEVYYQEKRELTEMPKSSYGQIRPVSSYDEFVYSEIQENQDDRDTKICKENVKAWKLPALLNVDYTEWIADDDVLDHTAQMCPPSQHRVDDYIQPLTVEDKINTSGASDHRT